MKAIIKLDIPDFQIGQEVCVSFPDTMMIIGITEVATDTVEELEKIRAEIMNTGAYEQEVNGKTEFLKGINYCLSIIDKYKAESEEEEFEQIKDKMCEMKEDNKQIRCDSCRNNTDELSGECYECVKGIEDWYDPKGEDDGK